jgi:hypothetical protein
MRGMTPLLGFPRDLIPLFAAWWPRLGDYGYRRLRCEANPFNRIAVLLEALGVHPLMRGFEAPLRQAGRMRQE